MNRTSISALALLLAASFAFVLSACGDGDDEDGATATPEATEEATASKAADEDSVRVNEAFWHAGWKVTLEEATLRPGGAGSADVSISATFENLGADEAIFDSELLLTSGGNDYSDDASAGHDLPLVPGERTGEGSFNLSVDEEFSLDDATLIVGNPDNNQAIVPIGSEGDDLISLEPREIAINGDATAGALTITVERAELRADPSGPTPGTRRWEASADRLLLRNASGRDSDWARRPPERGRNP